MERERGGRGGEGGGIERKRGSYCWGDEEREEERDGRREVGGERRVREGYRQ